MNDDLRGIIADLQSRLDRIQPSIQAETVQPTTKLVSPYWDCTYCLGLTLTTGAGLDWDPLFDNTGATSYMKYRLPAGYGSFDKGNLGLGLQRRWVLVWDSPSPATVTCLLSGTSVYTADTDANIQVKLNGKVSEVVAGSGPAGLVSQQITLNVIAGRNRLAISADVNPDTVQFCGLLFTDPSQWVEPRGKDDATL